MQYKYNDLKGNSERKRSTELKISWNTKVYVQKGSCFLLFQAEGLLYWFWLVGTVSK